MNVVLNFLHAKPIASKDRIMSKWLTLIDKIYETKTPACGGTSGQTQ